MKYVLSAALRTLLTLIVPSIRTSVQRSKQKRTMADIRNIATAWEAFAEKAHTYSVRDVPRALEPTYVTRFPRADGWGTPFELAAAGNHYSIRFIWERPAPRREGHSRTKPGFRSRHHL